MSYNRSGGAVCDQCGYREFVDNLCCSRCAHPLDLAPLPHALHVWPVSYWRPATAGGASVNKVRLTVAAEGELYVRAAGKPLPTVWQWIPPDGDVRQAKYVGASHLSCAGTVTPLYTRPVTRAELLAAVLSDPELLDQVRKAIS